MLTLLCESDVKLASPPRADPGASHFRSARDGAQRLISTAMVEEDDEILLPHRAVADAVRRGIPLAAKNRMYR